MDASIINKLACKLCRAIKNQVLAEKYGIYCPDDTDLALVGTYLFVAEDSTCDLDHALECTITDYASDQSSITTPTTEVSVSCDLDIYEILSANPCSASTITISIQTS